MYLPPNSVPVSRSTAGPAVRRRDTVAPQNGCAGVPNGIIGKCMFNNGPPAQRMNCTACCAMRNATAWIGGGYVIHC